MGLTAANDAIVQEAPKYLCHLDVTFDDSYPTGGESLDYDDYIPSGCTVHGVVCRSDATYRFEYDYVSKKLVAITWADGAEVTNGTNLAAVTAHVCFICA
jgi:hypothetical protein